LKYVANYKYWQCPDVTFLSFAGVIRLDVLGLFAGGHCIIPYAP
jgi:hypothetical protein